MSDNVRPIRPTDDVPTRVEFYDRAEAAQIARDLLVVKAGKYAERPVDPADVIALADWLIYGDVFEEDDDLLEVIPFPGNGMTLAGLEALRAAMHPFTSDGLCKCGDCGKGTE